MSRTTQGEALITFRKAGAASVAAGAAAAMTLAGVAGPATTAAAAAATPTTPIKHVVVIFQENVSFDHYFGTYPGVNGLTKDLLTNNPNKDASGNQVNPRRLDPTNINDVLQCDQDHNYPDEQKAFDNGAMDKFVTTVGTGSGKSGTGQACNPADVMSYFDGSGVPGMWNYAQHAAMSDNSFGTTFGPSAPGAINLAAGDTGGVDKMINGADTNGDTVGDGQGGSTLVSDAQPYFDDCSTRDAVSMSGKNVGDLLNTAGVSWGWFQGGFTPTTPFPQAAPGQSTATFTPDQFKGKFVQKPASDQGICNSYHPVGAALGGTGTGIATNYGNKDDYIAHHEPFQYYPSTANPHHLPPASLSAIGTDTQTISGGTPQFDTANHQYDMSDFDKLVGAINAGKMAGSALPAVSYLKASGYQDGHAGYSDPIDEQQFIAREINALQKTPEWSSTAVVISYDDSDGWYDHAYSGVTNPSNTSAAATPPGPQDFLTGAGLCGGTNTKTPLAGENGRCGYGPRIPLMVISPYAKANFVDHTLTDQSSILRFIEDNWGLGRIAGSFDAIAGPLTNMFDFAAGPKNPPLFLNPTTGAVGTAASDGLGYVTVTDKGVATSFGDGPPAGSAPAGLAAPIVKVSGTPDHRGYRMVGADGGVFSFGDAAFYGSTGNISLNRPVIALAPTPTLRGYWLVAEDGGVFSFGDAKFFGSTGAIKLAQPIVAATMSPTGNGYYMVATDGGVFNFGDAVFKGSNGGKPAGSETVGIAD